MAKVVRLDGGQNASGSAPRSSGDGVARGMFWFQIPLVLASAIATFKGIADFFGITEHGVLSAASWMSLVFAGLVVFLLTGAMWFSIEWVATRTRPMISRIVFFLLYLIFLVWSVGFGYGFWWSILSADDQTNADVATWASDLKINIADANGQLSAFVGQLDRIRDEANRLKDSEQKVGGTCGRPSGGGCRELCRARIDITDRLENISITMKKDWLTKLQEDLGKFSSTVNGDVEKLNFKPEADKRRGLIQIRDLGNIEQTEFNAFSKQRSQALKADLGTISDELKIAPSQPGFKCYNPEQAASIERFVKTLNQPPLLRIKEFKIYLGADSTKVAILKLWRWVATGVTGLELKFLQATGFESEGASATLHGNDWVALMATCLVDLAILIMSLFKPRPAFASLAEASRWLDENFPGRVHDFVEWYSKYQVDHWRTIYIVRPTAFWNRNSRDPGLSVDEMGMIARPLIDKKLIVETRPTNRLLTLAQQVLQQKGWSVQSPQAPATVYKVIGGGLAQLFAVASRDKAGRYSGVYPRGDTSTTRGKWISGDRGPGE